MILQAYFLFSSCKGLKKKKKKSFLHSLTLTYKRNPALMQYHTMSKVFQHAKALRIKSVPHGNNLYF